ncbi:hypothetical protein NXW50_10485 [Bacteroides thetaiotaomicron]|nr:hypothetical protein [Bacteroides thetaiotaomicron]MCS2278609.1 hypothetical protein [Bacteroides thetaiotaomicron]
MRSDEGKSADSSAMRTAVKCSAGGWKELRILLRHGLVPAAALLHCTRFSPVYPVSGTRAKDRQWDLSRSDVLHGRKNKNIHSNRPLA